MASHESLFAQPKQKTMKAFQAALVAPMFAFAALVSPASWAQGQADHIMVAPKDLKWADVPSLPPGAKIAVIEGPLNEAKPFTFRLVQVHGVGPWVLNYVNPADDPRKK